MAKYYVCPTYNLECPYYNHNMDVCSMEIMTGDAPSGQCDEYDAYNGEGEEEDAEREADEEIREAKALLARSLEVIYLIGYDSGFTNPVIGTLTNDIKEFLKERN